jgi:hypothetical protein
VTLRPGGGEGSRFRGGPGSGEPRQPGDGKDRAMAKKGMQVQFVARMSARRLLHGEEVEVIGLLHGEDRDDVGWLRAARAEAISTGVFVGLRPTSGTQTLGRLPLVTDWSRNSVRSLKPPTPARGQFREDTRPYSTVPSAVRHWGLVVISRSSVQSRAPAPSPSII